MNALLKPAWVLLTLFFFATSNLAQDKSRAYYFSHDKEIIPGAQTAFREGKYELAVELCRMHYIISGDSRADALRAQSDSCLSLTGEMQVAYSSGQLEVAKRKAREILAINPDDQAAQQMESNKAPRGTVNGYEWVDLGLSVKWASCNVGASSPEEYGEYFAWGETDSKSEYTWVNYKFRSGGDSYQNVILTKYNTKTVHGAVDNKTCLDSSDDVASVRWGEAWRMPTKVEMEELLSECIWTWTIVGEKKGFRVTSRTNGNSIFLPGAGFWMGAKFGGADNYGYQGYYWSSTLDTAPDNRDTGYHLYFRNNDNQVNDTDRCEGFSVRPVTE